MQWEPPLTKTHELDGELGGGDGGDEGGLSQDVYDHVRGAAGGISQTAASHSPHYMN